MTRIRQVVGTRKGMGAWVGQSLTALVMIAILAYLLIAYAIVAPTGHDGLAGFIGADYVRVPSSIGALALVWHAWLGGKSVIMDYIKWPWFRVVKYVGLIIYLLGCIVWFIGVIWTL